MIVFLTLQVAGCEAVTKKAIKQGLMALQMSWI